MSVKEFFEKKQVKIAEGIVIAIASVGLILGGVNAIEVVPKITTVAVGVVTAIEAVITVIQGLTTKN